MGHRTKLQTPGDLLPSRPYTPGSVDHLSAEQLERLQHALTAARDQLLRAATSRVGEVQGPGRDGAGRDTSDRQDAAADEAMRGRFSLMADHERRKLDEIEAARERIEHGTYGICEDSGDEIPFARLWNVPTARRTVEAQEQYEAEVRADDEREQDSPY